MSKKIKKTAPRSRKIERQILDMNKYDDEFKFVHKENINAPNQVRTTAEMVAFLERNKDVALEGRVIGTNKEGDLQTRPISRDKFIEVFKENNHLKNNSRKFKEAFDGFARGDTVQAAAGYVGQDFVPLLGGPFYKQLYYYNDYLIMHQNAYFAYNHDPIAHAVTNIMVDFTLGKGFRVDCENPLALAVWRAFEEVNDLHGMMINFARELSVYGEQMVWWLPGNATSILYPLKAMEEEIPKGAIPRIRLIDPSNINEIVTRPEDIEEKICYVWLAPTQYQIYTGKDTETGKVVQSTKFIYQQIPADQIDHYKVNAVSNEKRGRSDLFSILGYLKRLRDSINYEIIRQQKNAAWSIDTTVEGDDADIDAYMNDQAALGTIPMAGMEFVHTKAVARQYLGNQGAGGAREPASFTWCLNMIAAGTGIPISYLGTHISGGQTRASAIVATEPVAKRFEMRQQVYERVIKDMAKRLFKTFGIEAEIEVTFPEIVTQDRSAKLKDLALAEMQEWLSGETTAPIAAKELGVTEYEYENEKEKIAKEKSAGTFPIAAPGGAAPLTTPGAVPSGETKGPAKPSAVTKDEKKKVSDNYGF